MVNLFDRTESVFAKRYSSFHMTWSGPEHESIAEYCSRVRESVAACDPTKFGPVQYETMVLIMGMKHPALDIFRTQALQLLNKDPDTSLDKIQGAMTASAVVSFLHSLVSFMLQFSYAFRPATLIFLL
uniref:Uncharacterized protein n=1 Tax=Panagrolaimus sp. PS1159 TaxID=55785 RepID=A0AC35GY03_9BILA